VAYLLDRDDLILHLRSQIGFLERSGSAFDSGFEDEAQRLASVIRLLVYDTSASKSLLGQLGEKDRLRFLDTAVPIDPGNLIATPGLVLNKMSRFYGRVEVGYYAPLGMLSPPRRNPPKPFPAWWSDPVTSDGRGLLFNRRDYVITMANKEGGSHVDPTLDAAWVRLTRDNAMNWHAVVGGIKFPASDPAPASVRQVAYEVEQTVRTQLASLL
jgi:hypothetical protein